MASPEGHGPSPADLPHAEGVEAVTGHETTAGVADAAAHGEGGGLPQLEMEYWGGQIVWLLILFGILYVLLSRIFIPRLRRALDVREETIAGAIATARQVQQEAEGQAEAARRQVSDARLRAQRTTAEAKAAAEAERKRVQGAEEAKLAQHLAQAEDRIRSARDQAMTSVHQIANETAQAMTLKLTGQAAAPAEMKAALAASRS
jgi:F-type H+-transporting ATPase subunit b